MLKSPPSSKVPPKVSIIKRADYNEEQVYLSVKEAIRLIGGMELFVKKNERILLKPNLLAAKPVEAAVTTHPSVIKALVRLVREAGATPVVGDSPGIGSARKVAERCGVSEALKDAGAELIEFKEAVQAENPGGHTFKRFEVAKEALDFDGIINLPKLKTHVQMFLTLGVKNLFGCVPGKRKPQWHLAAGTDALFFAGMLLDLYFFLNPRLTVMDAITGMEGNGPGSGDPRKIGLIFASADALRMDAVITKILGAKNDDVPVLKAAVLRGIDIDTSKITVLGEKMEDVRVKNFRFPPLISPNMTARLPYFIDRLLRKSLTSRPDVNHTVCTMCNICVEVCPPSVMEKKDRILIDYDRCIRCFCCQEMCPHGAITSREGWLKRLIPGI